MVNDNGEKSTLAERLKDKGLSFDAPTGGPVSLGDIPSGQGHAALAARDGLAVAEMAASQALRHARRAGGVGTCTGPATWRQWQRTYGDFRMQSLTSCVFARAHRPREQLERAAPTCAACFVFVSRLHLGERQLIIEVRVLRCSHDALVPSL